MGSIYDSYQLANSRLTRPYAGNTLGELTKVSDVLQSRYDASESGIDYQKQLSRNASVRPEDQALWNQRDKAYQEQIAEWAKRPDLENVTKEVLRSAKNFAGEYGQFQANIVREQEYQKHLTELIEKGPGKGGVSEQTAMAKLAMSKQNSQLQYDPNTGKYSGGFKGDSVAAEVDTNEWIKKVAGDVAASKGASIVERPDGLYFHKNGFSDEKVDFDKQIKPAIQRAYSLDPEIQSDFAQRAKLNAFKLRGVKANDIKDPAIKKTITDLVQRGMSESDAVQTVVQESTYRDLKDTLENYGRKYAYRKTESEDSYNGFTVEGQQKANTVIDDTPFIIPDAAMKLTDKQKDISSLQKGIEVNQENIANIEKKIGNPANLHPDEVSEYRRQLQQERVALIGKQSIITGAEDAVAKNMGYANAADLRSKNISQDKFNSSTLPKKGDALNGKTVLGISSLPYSNGTAWEIRFTDGSKITQSLTAPKTKESKTIADFQSKVVSEIKDNAEKYAFQPSLTPLNKKEAETLKTMVYSSPASVEFYKPGDTEPTKGVPEDFEIGGIKIMKDNGSLYLDVAELSTEAKHKGEHTGKNYIMRITPGSNVGTVIAKRLLAKDAKGHTNTDPDALAAASVLAGGNWSGLLNSLQNNEKIPVSTNSGRIIGYVERKGYINNGTRGRYLVYDENGTELNTNQLSENVRQDPGLLSTWLERALLSEETQEAKQKNNRYRGITNE